MTTQNPVFLPGPTNIPDRLRRAMNTQTIDHRSPEFAEHFKHVLEQLKPIFGTDQGQPFIFPATGTGGWEIAITNTLSPGDKVLAGSYGAFSDKWIALCRQHGLNVEVVDRAWGEAVPADEFARILQDDTRQDIKAVLVTHNETATGVASDVSAVHQALEQADHPALLMVDGVSSIASMPFRMDDWGVDVAVTGSQKGLMPPPGLAVLAMSQRALQAYDQATCHRAYFDIRDMQQANEAGSMPYTVPTNLVYGLEESLQMLQEEGLQQVFARHATLAEGVRRAVWAWGLTLCAQGRQNYSDTVTAIEIPEGFDAGKLVAHARERYKVQFGGGLGNIAGKAFRIGHLGDVTAAMILTGLATIEMAMVDLDYPIQLGSGVAAAQEYYRQNIKG